MEQIFHKSQIDGEIIEYIQSLNWCDNIDIYRVGDKLKIPNAIIKTKINNQFNISTLTEFEILFILNENLNDDFLKYKS